MGEVYAFRCRDNEDYFRTLLVRFNQLTGDTTPIFSETAIYGTIPDHIQEISIEQAIKEMRPKNMVNLNAFPFNPTKHRGMP